MFIPSCTPEFSPIENLFGVVKKKLRDFEFDRRVKYADKPQTLAFHVMNTMYNLTRHEIEGLYKKTFLNMNSFWFKLDRHELLKKLYKDRRRNP